METAAPEPKFVDLLAGDRCPTIRGDTAAKPAFWFDCLAGRYSVYCFFMSAADPLGRSALEAIASRRARFDDRTCSIAAVGIAPGEAAALRTYERTPGVRVIFDFDLAISRQCGAAPLERSEGEPFTIGRRFWLVLDPSLHVIARIPFDTADPEHERVFRLLDKLPPPGLYGGIETPAPILMLPNVFEPGFCQVLIDTYEKHGGLESGVMRDGKGVLDGGFKRRKDHIIGDQQLIEAACARIKRRVIPELERLFFMKATRIERHIVACYSAEDGGHFSPHRDNDDETTAHRRFAVSINLNDGFEGGGVSFPEFSLKPYRAPAGWALIFPCAAMHAVSRVTQGRRYAYLPFLYDEAGRKIREENITKRAARAAAAQPLEEGV